MVFSSILEETSPLFFVAATMTVLGGILLIFHAFRLLPFSRRERTKGGLIFQAMKALASACVFLLGLFLLMVVLFAQTYEAFTREEPVARVQCVSVEGLDYDMVLRFVPIGGEQEGFPRLFRLRGDQWAVGGHILQWHPWLNILGLHTGYRITRIEGRYLKPEDELSEPRTVFDMGNSRTEVMWRWLYRHHDEIPFVGAVYGSTAYTFPGEDRTFVVTVTLSGFKVAPDQKS
ncbi:MAG: hypothetical protein GTN74_07370 [Proteobacteria bacterium]|nr:hypothetical protein [Pseudomonadota bacterium]NIS69524.1 hypothetical protein [Pseudomonadota bacterium]